MTRLRRRAFVAGAGAAVLSPFAFSAIGQARPVQVGAALPFSGGLELFGEQARFGIDLAAAEINAAGGILGRPVEILYRDIAMASGDGFSQAYCHLRKRHQCGLSGFH